MSIKQNYKNSKQKSRGEIPLSSVKISGFLHGIIFCQVILKLIFAVADIVWKFGVSFRLSNRKTQTVLNGVFELSLLCFLYVCVCFFCRRLE